MANDVFTTEDTEYAQRRMKSCKGRVTLGNPRGKAVQAFSGGSPCPQSTLLVIADGGQVEHYVYKAGQKRHPGVVYAVSVHKEECWP